MTEAAHLFERHKRIARENPIYLSMETQDPAYQWELDSWLHILTVDAGYMCTKREAGGPVWHLSVSWQGYLQHIDPAQEAAGYARALVGDTGDSGMQWIEAFSHDGEHFVRRLDGVRRSGGLKRED